MPENLKFVKTARGCRELKCAGLLVQVSIEHPSPEPARPIHGRTAVKLGHTCPSRVRAAKHDERTSARTSEQSSSHSVAEQTFTVNLDHGGRLGDWKCPSCKNNNFAFRSDCNRCNLPKPGDAGDGFGGLPDQPTAGRTAVKSGADLLDNNTCPLPVSKAANPTARTSERPSSKHIRIVADCGFESSSPAVANSNASSPAIARGETPNLVAAKVTVGSQPPPNSTLPAATPAQLSRLDASVSSLPTAVERFLARQRLMGKKVDEAAASRARTQAANFLPGIDAESSISADRQAKSKPRPLLQDTASKENALARFVRRARSSDSRCESAAYQTTAAASVLSSGWRSSLADAPARNSSTRASTSTANWRTSFDDVRAPRVPPAASVAQVPLHRMPQSTPLWLCCIVFCFSFRTFRFHHRLMAGLNGPSQSDGIRGEREFLSGAAVRSIGGRNSHASCRPSWRYLLRSRVPCRTHVHSCTRTQETKARHKKQNQQASKQRAAL